MNEFSKRCRHVASSNIYKHQMNIVVFFSELVWAWSEPFASDGALMTSILWIHTKSVINTMSIFNKVAFIVNTPHNIHNWEKKWFKLYTLFSFKVIQLSVHLCTFQIFLNKTIIDSYMHCENAAKCASVLMNCLDFLNEYTML